MRELSHEEKSFLWVLFLVGVFVVMVVIVLILSGVGSFPPVEDTRPPDPHMSPF